MNAPLLPATGNRIDSPDNDSAFSDNASMLSSESSTSGGSRKNQTNGQQQVSSCHRDPVDPIITEFDSEFSSVVVTIINPWMERRSRRARCPPLALVLSPARP